MEIRLTVFQYAFFCGQVQWEMSCKIIEPNVRFTTKEREIFARKEGLHIQAMIIKFAYGKPVLFELQKLLPKQFDVKENCNIE
ncbi:hypothetical protein H5410_035437 [Solanum commersonii]|uniref:Uncharacterized protein n=1 Tax=Solanum commersonii TaxID=4109 RepID=A0A9J5Y1W4_SOLCO|nr:hypothetical protein H5410_035437 [Solanum commersonii]